VAEKQGRRQWNISIEIPLLPVDRRMGEQTDSNPIPEKEMVASKPEISSELEEGLLARATK
jgi:hypothetical protein